MNDEEVVISLKDAFVESINRIYEEYKLYMDKILDFKKITPSSDSSMKIDSTPAARPQANLNVSAKI